MTPRDRLAEVLTLLRRQRRRRLALEGAGAVLLAVAAALVVGLLITRTMGITGPGVLVTRIAGYGLVLAASWWFLARPLLRRASDAEFALYVEEREPALRQSLLTAVEQGDGNESSSALAERVIADAERALRPVAATRALERPSERRALRTLAITAALVLLALLLGPAGLRDAGRVLFSPWGVAIAATPPAPIVTLTPGDITVPRGGALDIRAALEHFRADGAELVFRGDSAVEWVRLPMGRNEDAFTTRLFDIVQPTQYYVEANGVRSRTFSIRVSDLPAVSRLALELRYPAYTGMPPERQEDGGDVAAVIGTTVIVEPTVTRPVREGTLTFDDGTTAPLAIGPDGVLRGSFRVRSNGFYRVDLVSEDGRRVTGGIQYAVEALADRAPTVKISAPGRDTKLGALDEVTIDAEAQDDFGVRSLELRYRVNGGDEQRITLNAPSGGARLTLQGARTLLLEEMSLTPGDLVAYHAVATDATGQEASSDVYFIEIRPFSRNYRQAESGQQPPGGGEGGGESAGEFVQRQRDIVAGTFNLVRDSAGRSERERGEDATTLAIAQGQLREEVAELATRLQARGIAGTDTSFAMIKSLLDSAAIAMKQAEEQLGVRAPRAALPPEQRALAFVQRADAAYRDVQIAQGEGQGGGGGGGGGQQNAEDLADLFELETDRMRNQYEAVQQQSAAQQTREVDETLDRLRQLASRQQQENERLQRQAEAMRERMGREASGGGGGAQRELARQAEEEARRLERLSREQQSPELAQAAQQMQRAADAMRQAATGSEAQGAAALEQLERAARQLEDARSSGIEEGMRSLAERAADLERRQEQMAEDVARLGQQQGVERGESVSRLSQQKEQLAGAVEALERDADRMARESRRDQPGAASRVREGADALRDQRVRDKIQFSRNVIRSGSQEYANAFEDQIGEDLARAREALEGAVGELTGESAARQQERAREAARALVQGVESLQERMQEAQGQQGQSGQSGQQGQQGGGAAGQPDDPRAAGTPGQRDDRGGPTSGRPNLRDPRALDPRQLSREFGLRRENAEQLRDLARAQGVDVAELDRAIRDLRQLEGSRALADLRASAALQAEVLERLRAFELTLSRQLSPDAARRGAVGARSPVPSEYRAEVEEYYRSLARPPRP